MIEEWVNIAKYLAGHEGEEFESPLWGRVVLYEVGEKTIKWKSEAHVVCESRGAKIEPSYFETNNYCQFKIYDVLGKSPLYEESQWSPRPVVFPCGTPWKEWIKNQEVYYINGYVISKNDIGAYNVSVEEHILCTISWSPASLSWNSSMDSSIFENEPELDSLKKLFKKIKDCPPNKLSEI